MIRNRIFDPGLHSTSSSVGLLALRFGAALLLIFCHGLDKFTGFDALVERGGLGMDFLAPGMQVALVVFAELFCAIAVLLGLATRWAAIPIVIAMSVAALIAHGGDPLAMRMVPVTWKDSLEVVQSGMAFLPGKEFALLYLVPFLALVFTGAGRFSLDAVIRGPQDLGL